MKRLMFAFIFVLSVNTICAGACIEEIKTFYTTYLTNKLHDDSKNEVLCKKHFTEEMFSKFLRLVNATDADPVIRAQDANTDAIETINVERLEEDWYLVSYLWNKNDSSTLTKIPLKAQNIEGNCKITYITPIWNGSQYGDELLSCEYERTNKISQTSGQSFLQDFYKAYVAVYCAMPKDVSTQLLSLRLNNLSQNAIDQLEDAELENRKDGLNGFDLLIDNFDFDCLWYKNIKFSQLNNDDYQITYLAGNKTYKIKVTIKRKGNRYLIDRFIF